MPLSTGQLAAAADVNIQTVRYYERRGLVPTPRRTRSGYRQYPEGVVRRIRFIKRAQGLGFSLREIQELLALRVRQGASADAVKRMTRLKIEGVERKVRQLQRIERALEELAAARATRQPTNDSMLLGALEDRPASGR